MRVSAFSAIVLLFFAGAQAASIELPMTDPLQEQQARALFHDFKCVVCEGQSLADSDAVLARQMRGKIRTMLGEGKSPEDIHAFFRENYGDRILMQPPFEMRTLVLWAAPAVLLLLGIAALWKITRPGRA